MGRGLTRAVTDLLPESGGGEAPPSGVVRHRDGVVRHGEVVVDLAARRATVGGAEIELTDAEFALLLHFALSPNQLVTRTELLARVWGMPMHRGSNLVDVVVCRLRRRLGAEGQMIETVRGLGYRFRSRDAAND